MNVSAQTLRLYSGLLASPGSGSLEVLRELALEHDWLRQPLAELENLPLGEWQAEHTRLFISGHPKTVCPPFESAFLGGTMFGPMPKDYSYSLPKKVRRAALRGALSLKRKEGKLILLNDFPLEGIKTRQVNCVTGKAEPRRDFLCCELYRFDEPTGQTSCRDYPTRR